MPPGHLFLACLFLYVLFEKYYCLFLSLFYLEEYDQLPNVFASIRKWNELRHFFYFYFNRRKHALMHRFQLQHCSIPIPDTWFHNHTNETNTMFATQIDQPNSENSMQHYFVFGETTHQNFVELVLHRINRNDSIYPYQLPQHYTYSIHIIIQNRNLFCIKNIVIVVAFLPFPKLVPPCFVLVLLGNKDFHN